MAPNDRQGDPNDRQGGDPNDRQGGMQVSRVPNAGFSRVPNAGFSRVPNAGKSVIFQGPKCRKISHFPGSKKHVLLDFQGPKARFTRFSGPNTLFSGPIFS